MSQNDSRSPTLPSSHPNTSRKWFFLEKRAIVDILAIIPVFTDILRALITNAAHETVFNTPAFLQAVQIFKLIRILRVFYVGRQFSSPAIRQGVILVLSVVCIIYISACLINMSEGIPLGSAVYFSVVTLATVGYGDVLVVSNLGRFFVSCLICVSFIWLPYEINNLTQMLSLRSRYLTTFTPRADKYVHLVRGRGGREGGRGGLALISCSTAG